MRKKRRVQALLTLLGRLQRPLTHIPATPQTIDYEPPVLTQMRIRFFPRLKATNRPL